jgi:outer membrane protein
MNMYSMRLLPIKASVKTALIAGVSSVAMLGFNSHAQAQSLIELYESAKAYDANYQGAKALFESTRYKADQSLAGLLPSVSLSTTDQHQTVNGYVAGQTPSPTYQQLLGTHVATLTAIQPLYNPANFITYKQSRKQLSQSASQLVSAEQDLLIRVSQAYFDLLASQDNLEVVRAQRNAIAEQLSSAKRNFEVGTATITDSREAQARYDLNTSQEIAAANDVRVKRLILDQLVGQSNTRPKALTKGAKLPSLENEDPEIWVRQAEEAHPSILNARLALEIAQLEVEKSYDAHKPTINFQTQLADQVNLGGTNSSGVFIGGNNAKSASSTFAVVMNMPLFAGMYAHNRVQETVSLEEKARDDLDAARRSVGLSTRTAYLGVVSSLSQVKALEAAQNSSQVALDANKLGYNVGIRINIDVLNAQSQLYQTKGELAKARYAVLVGELKLKQANGTLSSEDLVSINNLLEK